ncbi:MAG: thioesterase [Lachnospiraceae bacterium]|nr:thioesterase [Lachnospiraceae bacterium]
MYEFTARIRYSEAGPDGRLTLAGVVSYFQDCSFFESLSIGRDPASRGDNRYAWMLVTWRIVVKEYPKFGQEVKVSTIPVRFHAFEADRNFVMRDSDGRVLAYADSRWVYFDTENRAPARISEEEKAAYELGDRFMEEKFPRHVRPPKAEPVRRRPIKIRKTSIDINQHVNNEQYILFAAGYLPADARVKALYVDYQKQAMLGDTLQPLVYREENNLTVVLEKEGTPCATVLFVL